MAGLNIAQIQDQARGMGISLSESEADKILGQAWDQSQFGADPGKVSQILQSRVSRPSSSSSSYSATTSPLSPTQIASQFNFEDAVKKALEMQQSAIAPAVSSLKASIPEIQQRFETTTQQVKAEIDPLKQRYENLLDEIRQRGVQQEQAQTKVTSQELGKRGLVGSSTLAQEELLRAVQPIQQVTTGAIKDVTLSREEGLRNIQNILSSLPGQETSEIRAIQNAIAQLQASGSQTGIQQALTQGQFVASQALAQQQLQAQIDAQLAAQELARQQQALVEKRYSEIDVPLAQYQLNAPYYKPETGSSGSSAAEFLSMFGVGQQPMAKTGFANVDALISQGRYNEARNLLLNP